MNWKNWRGAGYIDSLKLGNSSALSWVKAQSAPSGVHLAEARGVRLDSNGGRTHCRGNGGIGTDQCAVDGREG